MQEKILFVDDDSNVLATYQRILRKNFQIDTALGPFAGFAAFDTRGPFGVVVADMNMPGLDGIQFLAKIKEKSPDTVRMMLTGRADLETAVDAVNEGNVFRFLTKPCPPETLMRALEAGIRHYRLVTAERVLLDKTLRGSVRVLTEILSMVDTKSFGRAEALRNRAKSLSRALNVTDTWEIEVAAMLSQIGRVTMPPSITLKASSPDQLTEPERDMLTRTPEIGQHLLANIPRLESVAQIVLYQNKHFDGTGFPADGVAGERIPMGSRILKLLADLAEIESDPEQRHKALEIVRSRAGWYDPGVVQAASTRFSHLAGPSPAGVTPSRPVGVNELRLGQILVSDVETRDGLLLLGGGSRVTGAYLVRIRNFARLVGIREPIMVEVEQAAEE